MSYELKRINFFDMNSDEEVDDDYWYERRYFDMITKSGDVIEIMNKEEYFGENNNGEEFFRKENNEWKEIDYKDEHYQFIVDVFYYLKDEFEFQLSDGNGEFMEEDEIEEMLNNI